MISIHTKYISIFQVFFLSTLLFSTALFAQKRQKPNVIIIYADDLGYGDLSAYGAIKISTPNIDRLAKEGLKFTNAHSTSATCTPSRFALMTGTYPWRKKGTGVLPGNASLIIPTDKTTLPVVFKNAGYKTGIVGKWHLGLGSPGKEINWNKPKVYQYYMGPPNNWTRAQVDYNIFEKYKAGEVRNTKFDPTSIMQYPVDASLTTDGVAIGWNYYLSDKDKAFIANIYPGKAVTVGEPAGF